MASRQWDSRRPPGVLRAVVAPKAGCARGSAGMLAVKFPSPLHSCPVALAGSGEASGPVGTGWGEGTARPPCYPCATPGLQAAEWAELWAAWSPQPAPLHSKAQGRCLKGPKSPAPSPSQEPPLLQSLPFPTVFTEVWSRNMAALTQSFSKLSTCTFGFVSAGTTLSPQAKGQSGTLSHQ